MLRIDFAPLESGQPFQMMSVTERDRLPAIQRERALERIQPTLEVGAGFDIRPIDGRLRIERVDAFDLERLPAVGVRVVGPPLHRVQRSV